MCSGLKTMLGHLDKVPGGVSPGPLQWRYPCCGMEVEDVFGCCCCYFRREEIPESDSSYIGMIVEGFVG